MTRSGKSSNCVINAIEYENEKGMIMPFIAVLDNVHCTEIFPLLSILALMTDEVQAFVRCDSCH